VAEPGAGINGESLGKAVWAEAVVLASKTAIVAEQSDVTRGMVFEKLGWALVCVNYGASAARELRG